MAYIQSFAQSEIDRIISQLKEQDLRVLHITIRDMVDRNFLKKFESQEKKQDSLAFVILNKVVEKTTHFSPSKKIAVYSLIGFLLANKKKILEGYKYMNKALSNLPSKKPEIANYCLQNCSRMFSNMGRLDSAIFYAERELDFATQTKNDSLIILSLQDVARLCYDIKNYSKAAYYLKILLNQTKNDINSQKDISNTLGLCYRKQSKMDSARYYFKKSLEHSIQLKKNAWIGITNGNIGYTYFLEKNYDKALEGLMIDLEYSRKAKNLASAANCLITITKIYLEKNDMNKVDFYYDTLASFISRASDKLALKDFFKLSSDFFEKKNNFEKSLYFLKRYNTFSDSLQALENIERATFISEQYAFDRQVTQIQNLEKEKNKQEEVNRMNRSLLFLFSGLMVLGALFVILLYRNNLFKQKTNQLLSNQKKEIEQKNAELAEALILLNDSNEAVVEKNEQLNRVNEELKVNNEKIAEQADRLHVLNETKDKLFSIIGHDMRSPINSLKGLLALVADHNISPDDFKMLSVKLQSNVEYVHFTLTNLLEWANSQMEGIKFNAQRIDLKNLANETILLLSEISKNKNIELQNLLANDALAFADKDQINLIIRNLMSNAIKFTAEGGKISISSKPFDEKFFEICVEDSGVGMSKEAQSKLFNPQTHSSTQGTQNEKGTGLGLMLCKDFVEKNGGKIWIESELGKGSRFYFTLPKNAHIEDAK